MAPEKRFNPNDKLTKLKGSDYLEVKWRIVWFRDDHPDGIITTEAQEMTDQRAVFSAYISIPGGGSATGFGSETPGDFKDYIEKAETKAIGRALAALGYGTQFAPELDEGARIVDSPVERSRMVPNASKPPTPSVDIGTDRGSVLRKLHATGKDADLNHDALHALIVAKGYDSMSTAPVEALVELGRAIKADPGKLKTWLAKQAELMPSPDVVPDPARHTA